LTIIIKRVSSESTKIDEKRSILKKKSSNKDNNNATIHNDPNNILEMNQALHELKDVYELENSKLFWTTP